MSRFTRPLPAGRGHLDELAAPLAALRADAPRLELWGRRLAAVLVQGGRLLAAGNGGSASQASHLTSELVGRYRDDRPPFSAIALCAESSAVTAIGNDYGIEEVFARQVRGHGRPGDVLVLLSTSGASPNVLAAADAGVQAGRKAGAGEMDADRAASEFLARAGAGAAEDPTVSTAGSTVTQVRVEVSASVPRVLPLPGLSMRVTQSALAARERFTVEARGFTDSEALPGGD